LPKILELEQHVADLIAAGEVVQRPSSVVKELIENSIDSGAGVITIEIASGGMTYIRVTDNGCGIAASDVKTAFLRHATSKLKNARELEAIGTLGFRGEALAAIAAVSRIELLTREPGANEGVSLRIEAGEILDIYPAGCPEGTTIIVRDLFFNTPARLKFMKTDRAEGSNVASVVLKCALSRSDISMRFIKDGKTEYHTPGDSRMESNIYSLLGRDIEAGFLPAKSSDEVVSVKGFISSPVAARGNRSYQFFFVNGRTIRSLLLQSALEQAYKNTLPSGRFPSCVLFITTKYSNVDVNVHPAKAEVKFVSEKHVFDGVYYAALGALNAESGVKSEGYNDTGNVSSSGGIRYVQTEEYKNAFVSEPSGQYKDYDRAKSTKNNYSAKSYLINKLNPEPYAMNTSDPALYAPDPIKPYNLYPEKDSISPISYTQAPKIRVIGEALNVYIITEYMESVWFIDKHAAHERIHYDALRSGDHEPMSEALITPVICRIGHDDASLLLENTGFLENLGFSVESFGEDSVAIRNIPADIDISDTESVLSDLCSQLKHGGAAEPAQQDKIFKTIACKAAIKAGRASGRAELEALAERVMSGEISHCPHGRNVAFEVSKVTLDKGFGRI